MMKISFAAAATAAAASAPWQEHMQYAYTRRFDETATFVQEEDCVVNCPNPGVWYGYDNIPLLTKEKVSSPVTVRTRCSFDSYGAPLIMLTSELYKDGQGVTRFEDYYEVVLWENGINVWHLWPGGDDPAQHEMTWVKLMSAAFPVAAGIPHDLTVKVDGKTLHIETEGQVLSLYVDELPETFYVGIDACEGVNRFWGVEVE